MKTHLLKAFAICVMALFAFACSGNEDTVAVTGVYISDADTDLMLEIGQNGTMTAKVAPGNATDKSVTWSSDDDTVATVDQSGVVTAVAVGNTNITVTTNDGGKTASRKVIVSDAAFMNFENACAEYFGAIGSNPAHFAMNLTTTGKTLHLEFYGDGVTDGDTPILKPGDYSAATGTATTPGTFIPGSATGGSVYVDGAATRKVANGKFTISFSESTYTVNIELKDDEDKEINGSYTGPIELQEVESDFKDGSVFFFGKNVNYTSHMFFLNLIGKGISVDHNGRKGGTGVVAMIPLFCNTDNLYEIPKGTYTVTSTDDPAPGTIMAYDLNTHFLEYFRGTPTDKLITSGTVEVSRSGEVYHIVMDLVFSDGSEIHTTYYGELEYENLSNSVLEDIDIGTFSDGSLTYYSNIGIGSNFFITTLLGPGLSFAADGSIQGSGYALSMQMYADNASETEIAAGTYIVAASQECGTIMPGYLLMGFVNEGSLLGIFEDGAIAKIIYVSLGTATFSGINPNYSIQVAFDDGYGFDITGSYTGKLDYSDKSSQSAGASGTGGINKYLFSGIDIPNFDRYYKP